MRTIYWRDIVESGQQFHLARRQMRGRRPCGLHDHDFAEIFWLESGRGVEVVNGVRQTLSAGDLQLIRPADAHEYFGGGGALEAGEQAEDGAEGGGGDSAAEEDTDAAAGADAPYVLVNLAFAWETVAFLRERYFSQDAGFFGGHAALPAQYRLSTAQIRAWHQAVVELSTAPRTAVTIERFLLNLFHDLGLMQGMPGSPAAPASPGSGGAALLRSGSVEPSGPPLDAPASGDFAERRDCPEWLRRACEQIRDPGQFPGGTRRLAELAGRSAEHLAREARRCFGVTPTEIVNRARLSHAAGELSLSSQPILEIALGCGFASLAHFYALFRREFGLSPRQYRLKAQAAVR
ncbi:MAG: AraC family transcriptional regulator [Planctomycetota bacterium]